MQEINIDELIPHPRNTEFFDDMSGEKWNEFLESVKSRGVIEPVVITQDRVIVSGHQRVRACKELGIEKVTCDIHIYNNEDEILQDLIETNIRQRGNVGGSSKKVGLRIKELERIYGIEHGGNRGNQYVEANPNNSDLAKSQSDIAKMMGISVDTLRNYKMMSDMIPELSDLVDTGIVTKTTALAIMKELSEEEQLELISSLDTTKKITQKQAQYYIAEIKQLEERLAAPQEVKVVDNTDYDLVEQLKSQIEQLEKDLITQKQKQHNLESLVKLTEAESKRLKKIQDDIRNITQQKDAIGKRLRSVEELSGLVYDIQETLEKQLAPIKFKRCMDVIDRDEVVMESLREVVSNVEDWVTEMKSYLQEEYVIDVE